MAATSQPRVGRLLADRYRLEQLIATGGMAEVWEATDEILTRKVAVKILHSHLAADESLVARFRAEALAAARLAHPSIVSVYDTCHENGDEAIVMELVRGKTLRKHLEEHGPLEPGDAVAVVAQVADALDAAHQAGVVHRDVKPGNILLCDDGRVMVADFGIAKAAAGVDLTATGTMLGTPAYLAPEQVTGDPVDPRTDVYALGLVLYEVLCGRPPFAASTGVAAAVARLEQEPLRPRQVRAGIPRPVEDVVLRAMAKAPEDRFPDAAAMRAALVAVGGGGTPEPPAPLPDTTQAERRMDLARTALGEPPPPKPERRWLAPGLIILVAVTLGVAGLAFSRTDRGQSLLHGDTGGDGGAGATTVAIASAEAFDPDGDGHENDSEAVQAIDADPGTTWSTEGYNSRTFGNLKSGVGIVLRLAQPVSLGALTVQSPSTGWAVEVYVAAEPGDDLAAWGAPVATQSGLSGDVTLDLGGAQGGVVLLWITDLGDAPPKVHAEIGEATLTAA